MDNYLNEQNQLQKGLETCVKSYKEKFENEECSDKLRDTILFQSHNNLVLTTFINKIINDNLLEGLITEAGKELTKRSQITKNLESKFKKSNQDFDKILEKLNTDHEIKMKELKEREKLIDSEFLKKLQQLT